MEWVGGLKIKADNIAILAKNKVNYYPNDLCEFANTITKGSGSDYVEINFDEKSELTKAKQILGIK